MSDGRDFGATLVGASPAHDLAVLHVTVANSLTPVLIGTSSDLSGN
jgi:S1-C subfamily serine protease